MEQINLDLIPGRISPICHASQYDVGRVIRINIIDGYSQPYTLDGTEAISVNVRKTDGNVVVESLEVVTGRSYVDVVTTEQMTCCYGSNVCDLTIEKSNVLIGTLNFILEVEQDPLDGGVESTTVIHNLTAQIRAINEEILPGQVAEQLATMYDGSDVLFDDTPTENHGVPYTVTSEGIKAKFDGLDLSENSLNNVDLDPEPADGDALVYNATTNKWINAEAGKKTLAELNDVDLTTTPTDKQVLIYDDTTEMWIAGDGSRVWQGTQAQYDALTEIDPDVTYFITDGQQVTASMWEGTAAEYAQITDPDPGTFYFITDENINVSCNLQELNNVNISNPADGQVLLYNGSNWVNSNKAMQNKTSTVTFNESYANCRVFLKDGWVHISYQGENKTHSASEVVFVLPTGLRPAATEFVPFTVNTGAFGVLFIYANGNATVNQVSDSTVSGRIYFSTTYPVI